MKTVVTYIFFYQFGIFAEEVKNCALNEQSNSVDHNNVPFRRGGSQHLPGAATGGTRPTEGESERRQRTTISRFTFIEGGPKDPCDWTALICMRVYKTGILCGRTMYYMYDTFKNACELDYVNCILGHEMWMVVHMGECILNKDLLSRLVLSTDKEDESFLTRNYALSDLAF